jgi:hypothetical protein
MSQTESKIIVIYIGVAGIRSEDIDSYVHKITNRITPTSIEAEIITIPVHAYDVKIECINPKYITDDKLIEQHTNLMKELHEELQHQVNQLKEENGTKKEQ